MKIFKYIIILVLLTNTILSITHATIYLQKPEIFNPKFEAVGCFLEHQEKILLLLRQNNKSQGNTWGIPGGKLEKDETPIETAIRETFEETAFKISTFTYLGSVFIKYPTVDYIYHMVMFKFTNNIDPNSVKINPIEHKAFCWVTPKAALIMNLMLDEDPCIRLIYKL